MNRNHLFKLDDVYLSINEMENALAVLYERMDFLNQPGLEEFHDALFKLRVKIEARYKDAGGKIDFKKLDLNPSSKTLSESLIFFVKAEPSFPDLNYLRSRRIPLSIFHPIDKWEYMDIKTLIFPDSNSNEVFSIVTPNVSLVVIDTGDQRSMDYVTTFEGLENVFKDYMDAQIGLSV